jgi:hypothetical protein
MKKFSLKALFAFTLMIIILSGCTKPEKLLIGKWEMTNYFINGSKEPDEIKVFWTFLNDGTFRQTISFPNTTEEEKGNWLLDYEKKFLTMDYAAKTSRVKWKIVKFEPKILEVNYRIEGFFVEREFRKVE